VCSPDGSRSPEYISNYMLKIRDRIARLPGVADFQLFSERDYAMRIWIDRIRLPQTASARPIL
jgi:multidrug efflux pump subunit AcrB